MARKEMPTYEMETYLILLSFNEKISFYQYNNTFFL
jgi:hypothetical protein